jgi:hypothetical protein
VKCNLWERESSLIMHGQISPRNVLLSQPCVPPALSSWHAPAQTSRNGEHDQRGKLVAASFPIREGMGLCPHPGKTGYPEHDCPAQ